MKKKILLTLIFQVFILGIIFSINPQRNYFDQISFIKHLGSNFEVNEIGSVNYNNIAYPISKITFNPNSKSKNKILVLCGVHGNEPAPVLAVSSFLQSLNNKVVNTSNPCIEFIYIVNPWGYSFNQRSNGSNIDINRDITTQESQEVKVLRKSINIKDYTHVFDFHEGNTKGYYLYYYSKKQLKNVNKIIGIFKNYKLLLENEYTDVILRANNGLIFVPWYAKKYMEVKKTVTTTLWTYDNGIDSSFTIETSKNRNIEERKQVILKILDEIERGSF